MAKSLSSFQYTWSKRMPMSFLRYFSGSFNPPPICEGRDMGTGKPNCHPKEASCMADMKSCGTPRWPRCQERIVKLPAHMTCCCDHRLIKPPCEPPKKKKPRKKEKKPFKSMWEVCGVESECPDLMERLDKKHYVMSDKEKRVYTQTWQTCEPTIRKRVVCHKDVCMVPPMRKRSKKEPTQTAKERDTEKLKIDYNLIRKCLNNVIENPNTKRINRCRKILMPCCRKVRKIVNCVNHPRPSGCLKECCPHPSFSECDRSALRRAPAKECRCLDVVNQGITDVFAIRKAIYSIPPTLPAWPPTERPK